jgi:hypothetical protein
MKEQRQEHVHASASPEFLLGRALSVRTTGALKWHVATALAFMICQATVSLLCSSQPSRGGYLDTVILEQFQISRVEATAVAGLHTRRVAHAADVQDASKHYVFQHSKCTEASAQLWHVSSTCITQNILYLKSEGDCCNFFTHVHSKHSKQYAH